MATRQIYAFPGTGVTIGQKSTDKVSFYGATPIVQASAVTAATDLATSITAINALITALKNLGITQ